MKCKPHILLRRPTRNHHHIISKNRNSIVPIPPCPGNDIRFFFSSLIIEKDIEYPLIDLGYI
ncbi:hypothetical protein OIU77_020452 [Salix suchowensis]|uniref:Uncharacterized protein n=1 Tax=Salix suchowensis TaxID=1278906 RepID=A0ABQ9C6H5_9ROSI|nr:hypothetical protein OIU77_020452 [Salix suchowensis]